MQFLWNTHSYINEYIRFSDTKSAIVIVWCSALFGVLVEKLAHQHFIYMALGETADQTQITTSSCNLSIAAHGLLAIGFVLAVLSILPKLWSIPGVSTLREWLLQEKHVKRTGLIYWGDVLAYGSATSLSAASRTSDSEHLLEELRMHIYVLSGICSIKFTLTVWSIIFALLGSILSAVFLIFYC
ncbi:hypothetical protein GC163_10365 [bacterium]|nr:hypothetical protein [bacterium]